MTADPDLESLKAEARQLMRAARADAADPAACLKALDRFPAELRRRSPIAGYWPVGSEFDPRPLLAALAKAGAEIALPRVESRAGPVHFLGWRAGEPLSPDAFGVPAPPANGQVLRPRLVLTPLLGFDRAGRRLGQGGGHYDRILAALKAEGAVAVGLAYAAQEMTEVPTGPHDQRLDWVVTELEAIRCA